MTDVDGGVTGATWQWASSSNVVDRALRANIPGRHGRRAYTPVDADVDNYLRATPVSYTDNDRLSDKSAPPAVSASAVVAATTGPTTGSEVGDTYDDNRDGVIDVDEALDAIVDYFAGTLSQDGALDVIVLYFNARVAS